MCAELPAPTPRTPTRSSGRCLLCSLLPPRDYSSYVRTEPLESSPRPTSGLPEANAEVGTTPGPNQLRGLGGMVVLVLREKRADTQSSQAALERISPESSGLDLLRGKKK